MTGEDRSARDRSDRDRNDRDHTDADAGLRSLLREAVADVHPDDALPAILGHAGRRRRPGWPLIALAAAVATAVVIGGVAWLNRDHTGAPVAGTARPLSVTAYYLGDTANGPRLFGESRTLPDATGSALDAAVQAALGTPGDPDYRSGFPAGTRAEVTSTGDVVEVDLSGPGSQLVASPAGGVQAAQMAIQALVWTVDTAVQRPAPVSFRIDGRPATTLLGVDGSGRFTRGSADATLSPVSVELANGSHLASGSTVRGHAAAYEATVVWQLRRHGAVVRSGHTTADQCCTLSPFAFRLDAPPGHYTLVVRDTSGSGREGVGVTRDTKDVVID